LPPPASKIFESIEAQNQFGSNLQEKISFEKFANQLVDVPEFPNEIEEIDEGFDSVMTPEVPSEAKANEKIKDFFKNPARGDKKHQKETVENEGKAQQKNSSLKKLEDQRVFLNTFMKMK
jgi:hypothetical protein